MVLADAEPARVEKSGFLVRRGTEILMDGKPFRSVSVNKFDIFLKFLNGGSDRELAVQAIQQAADHGFRVIRFAAVGFYPKNMVMWPAGDEYWKRMDDLVATARKAGVWLIPTVNWNTYLFPDMAGETVQDMMLNRDWKSRQYLDLYVYQLVSRYKDEPQILFWELSNEFNLGADLEFMRPYGFSSLNPTSEGTAYMRVRRDNYTSDQMIKYVHELALLIRKVDSNHLIGSGYSAPRPSAQHLRRKQGDWTQDTPAEVETYIRDTHPDPIDLISIHFYPGHDNLRFGNTDKTSATPVIELKKICDRVGKPVYLGETGEEYGPNQENRFSANVLRDAVAANYPIILLWQWMSPDQAGNTISPERMPTLIQQMQSAQRVLTKP
jgi:hypothetical protein